ncbi:Di-copper centre-containing protein [Amniculicola lignicola CBS 123094]|uniref:Di-copper centre-containing protein n=1 Tax=Amniculicola lignicola CBS 123094 TaxID=1392246 RepID=A0A6A5VXR6_9PLEO|nr:Di-copper centre-containing protein [Amniculicola lignicola CBS 123094]
MRFSTALGYFVAGTALVAAAPAKRGDPSQAVPVDLITSINKYKSVIDSSLSKKDKHGRRVCNHRTVAVRKEWRTMKPNERKKYIKAVQCMAKRKSHANKKKVPGARNRLDDFVASHLIESNQIHFNGHLFAWHRHFVWLYETALRNECGYDGAQPYWDWTLDSANIVASPVFDGSPTSMGNNGEFFEHGNTILEAFGLTLPLPPGTGGGCLKPGPFSDLIVNLGLNQTISPPAVTVTAPIPGTVQNEITTQPEPLSSPANLTSEVDSEFNQTQSFERVALITYNEALNYNPRCLRRDLNTFWASQLDAAHTEYLLACNTVDCFQKRIDGYEPDKPDPQPVMHPAGHFSVGGLQNDPFASPGDPVFYLIHAQIDRLWSIWQAQDPARQYQVGGTVKPLDKDGSGTPVNEEDRLSFGVVDGKRKMKKLLSTIENAYCYSYDG